MDFLKNIKKTFAKLNIKQKYTIGVVFLLVCCALALLYYLVAYNHCIYSNDSLHFYSQDGAYILYSEEFAGRYEPLEQSLVLKAPLLGNCPAEVDYDEENKSIMDMPYTCIKKTNFDFTLNAFLKTDIFQSNIDTITNTVKKIKTYNNLSWFYYNILEEQRAGVRVVDEVENPLFLAYFSSTGDVESLVVDWAPDKLPMLKKIFDINRIGSIKTIDTPSGNSVFFAIDGTLAIIKNPITGQIAKIELRKYGSAGVFYIENFLTDIEVQNFLSE